MAYTTVHRVSIDHTKCGSSDSSNFTVLFSGVYAWLKTTGNGGAVTSGSGYDIVFSTDSAAATLLNWEVENWDGTTGEIEAWVKVATLSHTSDTVFYISAGNSSVTTFQGGSAGSAWDGNYFAIYHLNGASTTDSSGTGNDINVNTSASATSGQIAGASYYFGNAFQLRSGGTNFPSGAAVISISCWFKLDSSGQLVGQGIFGYGANSRDGSRVEVWYSGNGGDIFLEAQNMVRDVTWLFDSNWHYFAASIAAGADISSAVIVFDGVQASTTGSTGVTLNLDPQEIAIGRFPTVDAFEYLIGTVDEAKLANINRSAAWFIAEYNNQNSPSTFYSLNNQAQPASLPLLAGKLPRQIQKVF